jgi:hypothetical protein
MTKGSDLNHMLKLFNEFKSSRESLRIYQDNQCVFQSCKDSLAPLVEYISAFDVEKPVIILDKIVGNAAALLAVKANARKVYSPLGSRLAAGTLSLYHIEYNFETTVPFIMGRNGRDMCPLEKLSLDHSPHVFFKLLKARLEDCASGDSQRIM